MFLRNHAIVRKFTDISAQSLTLNSPYELPQKIPQLDRLRGLAILLVLICHVGPVLPAPLSSVALQGWIGVDMFFVLSGFLITGILWDTRDGKRYFRRFYGHRVLRIWPAYTLLLLFAFCIVPILKGTVGGLALQVRKEPLGLWAYLLMIQNLFPKLLASSMILHATWSLAIEEQFYLVWPAVIRYLSRRVALPCLLAGILIAPCLRIWAMSLGFPQVAIYMNPLTHGDGLLCGAIIAIWLRSARPKRGTLLIAGAGLLLTGLALFLVLNPTHIISRYCSPLVYTAVAILSSGLLLVSLVSENTGGFLHRFFFMSGTLSFLGFISYSLYLYHGFAVLLGINEKFLRMLNLWHHPGLTQSLMLTVCLGVSILLAWTSRVTIERYALSKKSIFG